MQIEEGFGDTKNEQYGSGLAQTAFMLTAHYNNVLLIAALALFLTWYIGQVVLQLTKYSQGSHKTSTVC
jgi:hypothetical protein